jgi:hypothetical protein
LLSVQHDSDDEALSFQHPSNWQDTCLSKLRDPQEDERS